MHPSIERQWSQTEYTKVLKQGNNVIAEYIWIDGAQIIRSKCKTIFDT